MACPREPSVVFLAARIDRRTASAQAMQKFFAQGQIGQYCCLIDIKDSAEVFRFRFYAFWRAMFGAEL